MKTLRWALMMIGTIGLAPTAGAQDNPKPGDEPKSQEARPDETKPRDGEMADKAKGEQVKAIVRRQEVVRGELQKRSETLRAAAKAQFDARRAQGEAQRAQGEARRAQARSVFGFQSGQGDTRRPVYTIMKQYSSTNPNSLVQAFGLDCVPADPTLRAQLELPAREGLVVVNVVGSSLADKAGIKKDDVIAKVETQSIHEVAEAQKILGDRTKSTAVVALYRRGKPIEVTLTKPEPPAGKEPYYVGVALGPVDATLRSQLPDLPEGAGLVVTEVTPNSPAAKAEARQYDIVVKLDDKPVKDNESLIEQIQNAKGEPIKVTVLRKGGSKVLTMTPERRPATLAPLAETVQLEGFIKQLDKLPEQFKGVNPYNIVITPGQDLFKPTNEGQGLAKEIKDLEKQLTEMRKAIDDLNKTLKPRADSESKAKDKD